MTFTYDSSSISTDLAKVRLILGDTDSTDQLLQDEEINYFLSLNDNVYGASVLAATAIQSKFSRLADTSIESVSVKYTQKADQYAKLSQDLKSKAEEQDLVLPSVLGVSIDAINDANADDDRVQPKFKMDRFSNPQNGESEWYRVES